MLVSIVIDNHNYEQFLPAAIDSALAQTWPDTEVIVVDDGSTDESRSVVESYGDRVAAVFKSQGGQHSALNAGFTKASGGVVIFLDADDRLHADTAERAAREFEQRPDLARVQWPMQTIDAEGQPIGGLRPNPSMMRSGDLRRHVIEFRTYVWPATSGNAYSANALRRIMPIPDDFFIGCDLYLAELTALCGDIMSLQKPGSEYRVHGANNWTSNELDPANLRQRIQWTIADHENVRKLCAELGLDCPESPTEALDVAFACQRLASLRLEPELHPIPGDTVRAVAAKGVRAAVRHPHHTRTHKVKRVAWIIGVAFAPQKMARKLIKRFYFKPAD